MLRTFRYPLHPTAAQGATLVSWLGTCQQLYNADLQHRRDFWEHEKQQRQAALDRGIKRSHARSVTYKSQTAELTALRQSDPAWLGAVPVEIERSALRRCDRAFKGFFSRAKKGQTPGFPRFRSRDRYDSFDMGRVAPEDDDARGTRSAHVSVPKLGLVKFNEYRPLKGKVRSTSIRRDAGRWYVCFSCDVGAAPERVPALRAVENVVGIDFGLYSLIATSDGETVDAPRHFRKGEEQLAMRQQRVSRRFKRGKKQSAGYRTAKLLVAKAHAHVRQQRLDTARKLAAILVAKYDVIAMEDLNVKGLAGGMLAKSVNDAAWGVLRHAITCKAESAGRWCVLVDPRGTSQRCSRCGNTVEKDLSVRVHACDRCGYIADRDVNAALNVKTLGRSAVLAQAVAT